MVGVKEENIVDWSKWDSTNGDSLKIETDRNYLLSFVPKSEREATMPIYKTNEKNERTEQIEKEIPCLRIDIDEENGQTVKKHIMISSKKLVKAIKNFVLEERDLKGRPKLYTWYFKLRKTGSGFQTSYEFYPMEPKKEEKIATYKL
jgi:hypothetical protein